MEIEILGQCSQHSTLVHHVGIAHLHTIKDAHEGVDDAVVANLYVILNIDERIYLYVVANLRLGRDDSLRTDLICHFSSI